MFKKIPLFSLIIIVIAAISISLLNFDDLSWQTNMKSYLGLIIAALMLMVRFILKVR
jgi:hypothetical protein